MSISRIYRISRPVEKAHGQQTFLVRADSEAEALKKGDAGDCVYESEDVEVYSLGDAELQGEATEAEYFQAEHPDEPLPEHLRGERLF